jgi:hypothetical protein
MVFIMTVCMALPMAMTGSVIVIPMPVIPKNRLAIIAIPVLNIPRPVYIVMHPGPGLIDHYFIPSIQIITAAPRGQGCSKNPSAAIQVNKLMSGNIIIRLDVR